MIVQNIRARSIWNLRALTALLLGLGGVARADLIHQGESAENLVKLSNKNGFGSSQVDLTSQVLEGNAVLVADMAGVPGDFSLRSVWYPSTPGPTNATYSVSARFLPQAKEAERRGGVMGWLDLVSSKGIALWVVPAGPTASFRVATVDFNAEAAADNESPSGLYGLNGFPAGASLGSSWTELGDYSAAQFALFELQFTPPSASDLQAVTNATARVKARVYQGTDGSGNPLQVGASIELLTDLPLPGLATHRVGYYAYNGNIFADPGPVGSLDDLSGSGGFSKPNNAPTVALYLTIPVAEARTVYDNAKTSLNRNLFETVEFGNQIILDNLVTAISRLDSFIFQFVGRNFSGDEAARIRFYKNDGVFGKPGTVIFDSDLFEIPVAPEGATVDLGDLGVALVPGTFTWAISFTGVDPGAGETAGLSFYGPPQTGGGFSDYWVRSANEWVLKSVPGVDASFGALIEGTPVLSSEGTTPTAPATFTLEASAADSDGFIKRVEFYSGPNLIAIADAPPYRIPLTAVAAGSYSYIAKAFDDQGTVASSAPLQVLVKEFLPPADGPESLLSFKLTLTNAANGFLISWPIASTGYRLEATETLLEARWETVSSANNSAVVPKGSASRFFRLSKP